MNVIQRVLNRVFPSKYKLTYNQDGLTTVHNNGFMYEPDFIKAEQAGVATGSWSNIHWRVHIILWAVNQCKIIEGDFVECGSNKGGFAKAICQYLNFDQLDKRFYLLDTFKGLSEFHYTESEKETGRNLLLANSYTDCYEDVKKTFSDYSNVIIVRGTVPETLTRVLSKKIAFLSIDMNCVLPEIAALNYFWEKLSVGGIIVLDDYAYAGYELQYEAHNNWAKEKGIKILSLPTGQGLIVK